MDNFINKIDFSMNQICRICMNVVQNEFISIFADQETEKSIVAMKIMSFAAVEVSCYQIK
jgi:hypothetical protein